MGKVETPLQLREFITHYFSTNQPWKTVQISTGKTRAGREWQSFTISDDYTPESRRVRDSSLATNLFTFLQVTAFRGGQHRLGAWYLSRFECAETPDDDGAPSFMKLVLEFEHIQGLAG